MSEIKIGMNLDSNQESFKTDIIQGKLDAVIIDSDKKVEVIIESELGYLIYKNKQLIGVHYICPRAITTKAEASLLDINQFEKFVLNEALYITIIGPKNTNINLILRIS
jgi:hypothetical protein